MNHPQHRLAAVALFLSVITGCSAAAPVQQNLSAGAAIDQPDAGALHDELVKRADAAPAGWMEQPGLVAALGGARVRFATSGDQEILLPLPQLADGQVPISYYIRSDPADAVLEYRLRVREDANTVVTVRLQGKRGTEVKFEWSSVILVAGSGALSPGARRDTASPQEFRGSTACVQSEDHEVVKLAEQLWPKSQQVPDYAANIQRFIREMQQAKRPRSLDAVGILDSGANGICTANANLTLALLRHKGIPSRSTAVIPTNSQRLEMHRIVEYFAEGQWRSFDPSGVRTEVPTKPWHNVIMAKTTLDDEQIAMTPRLGSMLGCPYAQELESLTAGITPWGQDFFWTVAKPLATFDTADEGLPLAAAAWNRYLQSGTLTPQQIRAAAATDAAGFLEALRAE